MKIRELFTKKRVIWSLVILLMGGGIWYGLSRNKNSTANIQTALTSRQDLKQTILTTGRVVSQIDLNLSFQGSGIVQKVNVAAGDKVKTGDVLAILSQANAAATLTGAQGSLAQAQANYKRVMAGTSPEQINITQKSVAAAQVNYNNSVSQLAAVKQSTAATITQAQTTLADLQSPTTPADNKRSAIVTAISNQLSSIKAAYDKENRILADEDFKPTFGAANSEALNNFKNTNQRIQSLIDQTSASLLLAQTYKSDTNIDAAINSVVNLLNGNIAALNYCFSALQGSVTNSKFTQAQLDAYKTSINAELVSENSGLSAVKAARQALTDALTAAQNAVINSQLAAITQITAAQNQINSARASLQQAQATLAQQQAKAQPADLDSALAQLLSAQGQVDSAQANFNNTILKAPADGTITQVDTKVGEQASAMQEVMVLQDISALHTEAYVSESNVAALQVGQSVDYTFDALGPDKHFAGALLTINPASTVISGVVNYLVKSSLPNIPEIKPGMTVNMTVLVATKNNVLAISSGAIINVNGKQSVRVVDNAETKTYHSVDVQTGLPADGGLVEIISGLSEGQEIVTYVKP